MALKASDISLRVNTPVPFPGIILAENIKAIKGNNIAYPRKATLHPPKLTNMFTIYPPKMNESPPAAAVKPNVPARSLRWKCSPMIVFIMGSTIAVPIPDREKKENNIRRFIDTPLPKAEILNSKSPIKRMLLGLILTLKAPIINAEKRATTNAIDLICAITPIG